MIEKKKVIALIVTLALLAGLFVGSLVCCVTVDELLPADMSTGDGESDEGTEIIRGLTLFFMLILLIPAIYMYGIGAIAFAVFAILLLFVKTAETLRKTCKVLMILMGIFALAYVPLLTIYLGVMAVASDFAFALGILSLAAYLGCIAVAIFTHRYALNVEPFEQYQ